MSLLCGDGFIICFRALPPNLLESAVESQCLVEFRDPRPLASNDLDDEVWAALSDRHMRQLLSIMSSVNRGVQLEQVLDQLYGSVRTVIPCNRLGLALTDVDRKSAISRWAKSDRTMLLSAGYQAPLKGSSLQTILETGHVRIINDLEAYLREHPASWSTSLLVQEGMRSSLTCPLLARGEPMGFLFFTSVERDAYSSSDTTFYQQIATQVALVIEKARLYSELAGYAHAIEQQNQKVRRDLELAAQLQRTFIPEQPPKVPGLDIALLYEPLAEVGGDLVELIPLPNGRLLVLMADAMGHGVSAALAMAVVKATFSAVVASADQEPGMLLQRLNRALPPLLKNDFAAGLALIIDPRAGKLKAARAGIPPPVIVDAATGQARALVEGGLPLSVSDSEPYATTETCFNTGDMLLLTTDGLTEAFNDASEEYGLDRLVAAAATCRGQSAQECLQSTIADLVRFRGLRPPADDMAVVLIRRSPDL